MRIAPIVGAAVCLAFPAAHATSLADHLAAGSNQTVVVYGTSLTAGAPWVGQMQSWLTSTYPGGLTLVNTALGGSASPWGLLNLDTQVLAYNPDTVFIEFAVNAAHTPYSITLQQSQDNLNSMVDQILAHDPQTEIILQTMNSAWDVPGGNQSASLRPALATYYQGYRDVAQDHGLLLVDHYSDWVALQGSNPALVESYVPDGIHPNAAGSEMVIMPRLQKALGTAVIRTNNPAGKFIVRPVAAAASSYYTPDNRNPTNAISGNGLSAGLATGDDAPTDFPTHDTGYTTAWLSASGGSGSTAITFDLGDAFLIEGFHLWNYNETYSGYDTAGRGMSNALVSVSLDNVNFTPWGSFSFAKAGTGSGGSQTCYHGEDYFFGSTEISRYIQFSNISNFGVDSYVGMSEIRFLAVTVPEPAPGWLVLVGTLELSLWRRL